MQIRVIGVQLEKGTAMYTAVIMLKRKNGMTREEFLAYYRDRHGPLMAKLMGGKGLISYEQFPVDKDVDGGMYVSEDADWDAVSIYTFESKEACTECWSIPEVIADSANLMEMDTMITLPTGRRRVYPLG
jgi:uncharacterized protein (TIGR02118 family)